MAWVGIPHNHHIIFYRAGPCRAAACVLSNFKVEITCWLSAGAAAEHRTVLITRGRPSTGLVEVKGAHVVLQDIIVIEGLKQLFDERVRCNGDCPIQELVYISMAKNSLSKRGMACDQKEVAVSSGLRTLR